MKVIKPKKCGAPRKNGACGKRLDKYGLCPRCDAKLRRQNRRNKILGWPIW